MSRRDGANRGCLAALFGIFGRGGHKRRKPFPYRVRDAFLTPAELSFYLVLRQVVGDRLVVLSKVGLWDIFYVARPNENPGARGHISQKHVDFLVCDPKTMQPVAGIELDDASHEKPHRRVRDAEVELVFETAELPLFRFPAQRAYVERELAAELAPVLQSHQVAVKRDPMSDPTTTLSDEAPVCPKCGAQMVVRVAKQGQHAGHKFYACSNYPNCKSIIPLKT